MSFKKKSALVQNRRWIMSILDVCCLSETKTFEQFSDFLVFTLSSKNSHQFGQNQPTDKFHHSIESWEWGEEDRTWAGGLKRLWRPPKRSNISLPNSLATVVCPGLIFNFEDMCPSKICKSVSYQLVVGGCRQLVSVCGQLAGRVFPPAVTYQLSQDARQLET